MPTEVFNQNFMYIDEQKHWAIKNDHADHEQLCKWLFDNGYMIKSTYRSNFKHMHTSPKEN